MRRGHAAVGLVVAAALAAGGTSVGNSTALAAELLTTNMNAPTTTTISAGVTRTTYTPKSGTEWGAINLVRVDPDLAPLTFRSSFGAKIDVTDKVVDTLKATAPSAEKSRWPYAGINGGFFDIYMKYFPTALPEGDPLGAMIKNGILYSEFAGNTTLLVQDGRAYMTEVSTELGLVAQDGAERELDGINRNPGRIQWEKFDYSTGLGVLGDVSKGVVFADDSEIVMFQTEYGARTPDPNLQSQPDEPVLTEDDDPGVEVVVDGAGVVLGVYESRGRPLTAGTYHYQGVGEGGDWLRDHAVVGQTLTSTRTVTDDRFGTPIPMTRGLYALAGRYSLVRAGYPQDVSAGGAARGARTAVGVDYLGRTMMVTVDSGSSGMLLSELVTLMFEDFGSTDAINMDGGGSTTLAVRQGTGSAIDVVVGNVPKPETTRTQCPAQAPGVTTGPRCVSDALFVTKGSYGRPS